VHVWPALFDPLTRSILPVSAVSCSFLSFLHTASFFESLVHPLLFFDRLWLLQSVVRTQLDSFRLSMEAVGLGL
jgi:hypothetical protein